MSSPDKLISVVVAVYNVEQYIERCANSILSQTYRNLEIILVDDGSTDGSSELCDAIQRRDQRVKVIHKANGGLSDARNVGLGAANGSYVTFIDGDDLVSPLYVAELYYPIANGLADFSVCNAVECQDPSPYLVDEIDNRRTILVYPRDEALCAALVGESLTLSACGKLGCRSLWSSNPFPKGRVYEDLYTIPKVISESTRIAHVAEPLYGQVMRLGSITRSRTISEAQFVDYQCAMEHTYTLLRDRFSTKVNDALDVRALIEYSRIVRLYSSVGSPSKISKEIYTSAKSHLKKSVFTGAFFRAPFRTKVSSVSGLLFPEFQSRLFQAYQEYKRNKSI